MNCRDLEDILPGYLDGALTDEEKKAVEEHLAQCGDCRESLEDLKGALELAAGLERVEPPARLKAEIMGLVREEADVMALARGDEAPAVEVLGGRERDRKVQECISALDDEQREVLVLRDIEGMSYEEISEALGLPDGTVKSRLFRARAALKNSLKKALGDLR